MRKHQLLGKVCKLTSIVDVLKHMICVYPITVLKIIEVLHVDIRKLTSVVQH